MSEDVLEKEKITTLFLKYTIPAIAGMLFLGINTIVDGFFVGHYIGVNALASVNIAMPFFSVIIAIGIIIGLGTQSLIGRKLGEGDRQAAQDIFRTAISLMTAISLSLSTIAVIFSKNIAAFLGANEQLMLMVTTYLRYEGAFLPLLGIMFVFDYVLKVMGKPIYSMQVLIAAVVSHMAFNYLMIVQWGLGVKGAALASGLGYGVAFLMAALPFLRGETTLKLFEGNFKKTLAYTIIYNGSAEGLTEICTGITTFLFNLTLMHYVGEIGVAAFTAISYLSFVGNNLLIGLSDGVGSIISYNYGNGHMERVKKALKLSAVSALGVGFSIFMVISNFAREIIAIFLDGDNNDVLNFAVYGAELYAFAFIVVGLNIVASGYFTAICYPVNSALIAISKGLIGIVVCLITLPSIFGIKGIWLTVPVAEIVTVVLSMSLMYKHFKYQN